MTEPDIKIQLARLQTTTDHIAKGVDKLELAQHQFRTDQHALVQRMTRMEAEGQRMAPIPGAVHDNEVRTLVAEAVARTEDAARESQRKTIATVAAIASAVGGGVAVVATVIIAVWPA